MNNQTPNKSGRLILAKIEQELTTFSGKTFSDNAELKDWLDSAFRGIALYSYELACQDFILKNLADMRVPAPARFKRKGSK